MANYFSLPLELRQQILLHAFALADEQDAECPFQQFSKLFDATLLLPNITDRIYELAEVRLPDSLQDVRYMQTYPL